MMTKRLTGGFRLLSFLLFSVAAFAQSTVVSSTGVIDTDGQVWSGGNYQITFAPNPSWPSIGTYKWTGGNLQANSVFNGKLNGSGAFSLSIPDNTQITPAGSSWKFTICPNAISGCFAVTIQAAGPTSDITGALNGAALAPRFPVSPSAYGYRDQEVTPLPLPGGTYFNVSSGKTRQWDGTVWKDLAGGGGSPPGGDITELQSNLNGTNFGGSGIFTSLSLNEVFTPSAQTGTWGYNATSNGQQLGCKAGRYCQNIQDYYQDVPVETYPPMTNPVGIGATAINQYNGMFSAKGLNNGVPALNETPAWSVYQQTQNEFYYMTPGISQIVSSEVYCYHSGDCAGIYDYARTHGGNVEAAGEGATTVAAQVTNDNITLQATIGAGATTGSTTFPTTGANLFTVGDTMYAINLNDSTNMGNQPLTGNACGFNAATEVLTDCGTSFTIPAAKGTNLSAVTIVSNPSGTNASITVNVTGGSNAAGFVNGLVIFGCRDHLDFVQATVTPKDGSGNQVISGNFLHGKPAGCDVFQGGTKGALNLLADAASAGGSYKTSWYVGDASDSSHINVYHYRGGQKSPIQPWAHNFGSTNPSVQLTRLSNVTTACNLGTQAAFYPGIPVQISGASVGDMNGVFTSTSPLTQNLCITYSNPGADQPSVIVATGTIGGAVGGSSGPGAYEIWNAAQVDQALVQTATTNGRVQQACCTGIVLRPNDVDWVPGQILGNLQSMAMRALPLKSLTSVVTAPSTTGDIGVELEYNGTAMQGPANALHLVNQNNPNLYINGPSASGRLNPPGGLFVDGVFGIPFAATQPYGIGPSVIRIFKNDKTSSNIGNNLYYFVSLDTQGGNRGFYQSWNPNLFQAKYGVNNDSQVGSSMSLNMTSIVLDGGTGGQLQVTNAIPLASTGSPTRTVTEDASGKFYAGRYFQVSTASGCTFGAGTIGTGCTVAMTIPVPYGSTTYNVTGCTVQNPAGGPSYIGGVANTSGSTFTVTQTAGSIASTGGGTIACQVSAP